MIALFDRQINQEEPPPLHLEVATVEEQRDVTVMEVYRGVRGKPVTVHGRAYRLIRFEDEFGGEDWRPDLLGYFAHGLLTSYGHFRSQRTKRGQWALELEQVPKPAERNRVSKMFINKFGPRHDAAIERFEPFDPLLADVFAWRNLVISISNYNGAIILSMNRDDD